MRKLLNGIVDFRANHRPEYKKLFERLGAEGQSPDTLFIACSDSRVVPNLVATTDPGDVFVFRNIGNLIPPCGDGGISTGDESEAAALEFATERLNVSDIIVCGHSDCGAMHASLTGREKVDAPHLRSWLRHVEPALKRLKSGTAVEHVAELDESNRLSQLNVLEQVRNVCTYTSVADRVAAGKLRVHAWWLDIARANVYAFEEDEGKFIILDTQAVKRILARLDRERGKV